MPDGNTFGFFKTIVEVGREVDRILVDVRAQHFRRDTHEARFGIPIRRRGIAVNRAEVSLPIHQWITQRKILRHTHQRVIHAAVTVRVISTQHIAYNGRAFFIRTAG